jgi:hypothetical protein
MATKLEGSESTRHTGSTDLQLEFRNKLWDAFRHAPLSEADLERSLGLFIRGSTLARFLATSDAYRRIVNLPGHIFDLGCWRGQGAVLCENLRAIYEPFNKRRRIVCFDTFEGYTQPGDRDRPSETFHASTYAVGKPYAAFLRNLLEMHEGNNAMPHLRGLHRVVEGDASKSVAEYLDKYPATLVALAFFDLGLYAPTRDVLARLLFGHTLAPGAVLVFYQLTADDELPGDAIAFKEMIGARKFSLEKSVFYPSMSLVTLLE